MFSIMLCYGHQSYEDCCWDDTSFVEREEETVEKGRREIFAFFSFSSSSSPRAVKNTTHVCLIFLTNTTLSPLFLANAHLII